MTRAFVAVRVPDVVLDAVAARIGGAPLPGRVTTRDQWHVTLQFLGDADIDAVATALEGLDVTGGRVRLGGAGGFPDARRARVLWIGVHEGGQVLERLAGAVAARTAALGHEPESQAFVPHLTIARMKNDTDARAVIASLDGDPIGPAWGVASLTVYESRRERDGARYVARATVPLPG